MERNEGAVKWETSPDPWKQSDNYRSDQGRQHLS